MSTFDNIPCNRCLRGGGGYNPKIGSPEPNKNEERPSAWQEHSLSLISRFYSATPLRLRALRLFFQRQSTTRLADPGACPHGVFWRPV